MPHTVPNRPMNGPGRADRRQHQQPPLQPIDLARERHVHHPVDAAAKAVQRAHARFVGALPLAHRRHEQRRDAVRVALRDLLVELLERLARPEDGLELVHLPPRAGVEEQLVDDDRPAPDRGDEQPDDHQLDDDVRLPEQREQGESARRLGQCGLNDVRIHESGSPDSDLRRLVAAECVQSAARAGPAAASHSSTLWLTEGDDQAATGRGNHRNLNALGRVRWGRSARIVRMRCKLDTLIAATLALATFVVVSDRARRGRSGDAGRAGRDQLSGLIAGAERRPDRSAAVACARPPGPISATVTARRDQALAVARDLLRRARCARRRRRAASVRIVSTSSIAAGLQEVDLHAAHGEGEPFRRKLAVMDAEQPQIVGAPALHEMQIARVIDAAGEIGVLEIDALQRARGRRRSGGRRARRHQTSWSSAKRLDLRGARLRRRGQAEMREGLRRQQPAARRALHEALLDQVGLDDVLDGVARLRQRRRDRLDADRPAAEILGDHREVAPVERVEAVRVHLQREQRLVGERVGDRLGRRRRRRNRARGAAAARRCAACRASGGRSPWRRRR